MTDTDSPSVLVVGAGAVGALFGSALARQGARVATVCRSEHEVVERDGYHIRSPLLGEHRFRPQQVYREVAECAAAPDYLILAVKVLPTLDRASLIRPAVGPRTVIVLIENGIDIEADVAAAFPENELLSALAFVGVGRTGPGQIDHQSSGWLIMGRYPSGVTPAAQRLAALFEAGKVGCRLTPDVVTARWQKAVWNAAFNPISIMGGVLDTSVMLETPQNEAFVRLVMQEICSVAAGAGHALPPQLIDQLIAHTKTMPAYKTSMALDYENGRPMEIEAILGNVVRTARRLDVPVPALESLYALAKMIEGSRA